MLNDIPPIADCREICRIRRAIWISSSTRARDASRITASAASEVTSLCMPKATPMVAACIAGASLIPSPRKSVGGRTDFFARNGHLLFGGFCGVHLPDAHLFGQAPHFLVSVTGHK